MLPFELTPATVVLGLVIIALAVLAVRRLVQRGTCDCRDHCDGGGCAGCGAVDKMVSDMEHAAKAR